MADASTLTGETGKTLGSLQLKTVLLDKGAVTNLVASTAEATIDTVKSLIQGNYKIKGNLAGAAAWSDVTDPQVGDVWNVGYDGTLPAGQTKAYSWDGVFKTGDNIVYTDSGWDKLAASVDTSTFVSTISQGTGIDVSRTNATVTVALDATTQASLGKADSSVQDVKLAGASSALAKTNGVVTIPNAVATGQTGATNGLMTAADKAAIATIPVAGTSTPQMDSGSGSAGTATTFSKSDHVHPTDTSRAPTSHASEQTTYGKATNTLYGHVKLSDSTNDSTAAAAGGTAATPKAVKDALDAAKSYADSVTPDLSSRIKKATVLSALNAPPATPTLPVAFEDLTVNQILNALYVGANENEAGS